MRPFGGLYDWKHPRGAAITLSGFNTGSNNTIWVTADPTHNAPDLDWIEVVGTTSSLPATGLCQPSLWAVSASVNNGQSNLAVDGDLTSRWTTGRAMANGDYYQIDFQGNVKMSNITMDNTQSGSNDYPGTIAVYTSQDGVNFNSVAVDSSPGAAGKTVFSFTQNSLRAIRIKVTSASSGNWWSIGEVQTDCTL